MKKLFIILAAAGAVLFSPALRADDYPSKAVRATSHRHFLQTTAAAVPQPSPSQQVARLALAGAIHLWPFAARQA